MAILVATQLTKTSRYALCFHFTLINLGDSLSIQLVCFIKQCSATFLQRFDWLILVMLGWLHD